MSELKKAERTPDMAVVHNRLQNLSRQLDGIEERLLDKVSLIGGPYPQDEQLSPKMNGSEQDTVLNRFNDVADRIENTIRRMDNSMTRLSDIF